MKGKRNSLEAKCYWEHIELGINGYTNALHSLFGKRIWRSIAELRRGAMTLNSQFRRIWENLEYFIEALRCWRSDYCNARSKVTFFLKYISKSISNITILLPRPPHFAGEVRKEWERRRREKKEERGLEVIELNSFVMLVKSFVRHEIDF